MVPKNKGPSKNGHMKLIQLHMYRALHSFRSFAALTRSLPRYSCCPRPPSHHPSSLTSVSLVPALRLLPSTTPFWPYGTHPFFPHAQTISILSDLLYSQIPFLFSSPTQLFIILTLSIRDTPTKLLKHFFSRTFTFLLSALLIPHASAPYNAVGKEY